MFNYRDEEKIKGLRLWELPGDVSSSVAAKNAKDLAIELAAADNEPIILRRPGDLECIETRIKIDDNISKLENNLQALEWKGNEEEEIEDDTEGIRKELQHLLLDRDFETERLQQFVVCIMDGDTSEPFYRVGYFREHEKEDLIEDRLSQKIIQGEIKRYCADSPEHTKILQTIMKTTLDTEFELMQEGSIAAFTIDRREKPEFIERARNVAKQETGAEPPMRKWCNDYLEQKNRTLSAANNAKRKVLLGIAGTRQRMNS